MKMYQTRQNAGAQALLVSQHVYKQARRLIQSGMKEDAGVLSGLEKHFSKVFRAEPPKPPKKSRKVVRKVMLDTESEQLWTCPTGRHNLRGQTCNCPASVS